ncbi:PAS domain S-box-containing protein [Loktanella atrilutea]|uniref:histidine kinase n=1 Tax=Loktanella atrilutea TaxID=366533 RepID=A0A1M5EF42_LOKAT|nr:HWE histidine kinase domain-containing protein [Loktanella atrilutea]SHF77913.1 PAS domain S-box-containing protein [Loktanella atrilutea]
MSQTSRPATGANAVLHDLPTAALKAAVQAANIGVWHWDLTSNIIDYSDLARCILGLPRSGPVTTETVRALTHPEDLPRTREIARRALDPDVRGSEVYSYRIIRPDTGETRWIQAHGLAEFGLVNGVQAALTYSGSIQDVTESRVLRQALEDQSARLQLAIEAGDLAVWDLDIASDTISPSPEMNRLFGFPSDATPSAEDFRRLYAPGEEDRLKEVSAAQMADGGTKVQSEVRYVLRDGRERTFLLRADIQPKEPPFTRAIGVLIDVTDRVRREQQVTTIALEMRHRLKNAFAVISAIASRSWPASDKNEGLKWFKGRLQAISAATDLMFRINAEALLVADLADRIIAPYRHPDHDPITLEGPDISVPPALATPLAMALHELATNAVKYGALSVPEGKVTIRWEVPPDGSIRIVWQEMGGPPVKAPAQSGFGSTLLGSALFPPPHRVEHNFSPDGVRYSIEVRTD